MLNIKKVMIDISKFFFLNYQEMAYIYKKFANIDHNFLSI